MINTDFKSQDILCTILKMKKYIYYGQHILTVLIYIHVCIFIKNEDAQMLLNLQIKKLLSLS